MEAYLREVFVPWAEQFVQGDTIYGPKLEVKVCHTWTYVQGTKDRRYTYAKVNMKDQCFYSASGSKPLCRYNDREAWEKIRWPCCPKPDVDRHEKWPISKWPPNVREYLGRACCMSDATMCRLVNAESYEAFTDEMFGDDPQQLYEDTQVDGIGYYVLNHTSIEGATVHALEGWLERKGVA